MAPLAPMGYVSPGGTWSSRQTIVFSDPQIDIAPTPNLKGNEG